MYEIQKQLVKAKLHRLDICAIRFGIACDSQVHIVHFHMQIHINSIDKFELVSIFDYLPFFLFFNFACCVVVVACHCLHVHHRHIFHYAFKLCKNFLFLRLSHVISVVKKRKKRHSIFTIPIYHGLGKNKTSNRTRTNIQILYGLFVSISKIESQTNHLERSDLDDGYGYDCIPKMQKADTFRSHPFWQHQAKV